MDKSVVAAAKSGSALHSVQVLRGLAALMVVLCHVFEDLDRVAALNENDSILNFGVDLFFVISGFIMIHATRDAKPGFRQFLTARVIRVVPMYWLALLAMLGALALSGGRLPELAQFVQAALFIPYADPVTNAYLPFLPVGWTLTYEMLFYLAFAATIALGTVRQVLMITVLFTALVAIRVFVGTDGVVSFRLTSPLFFEFSMGMIIGLAWPHMRRITPLLGLAATAIGIVGVLVLHQLHAGTGFPRFIAHGVPAAFILAGALMLEPLFARKIIAPLRAMGDASYSLYLSHPIPLLILPSLLPTVMPYWAKSVLLVAICLLLAAACYVWVERPMLSGLRRLTRSRTTAPNPAQ